MWYNFVTECQEVDDWHVGLKDLLESLLAVFFSEENAIPEGLDADYSTQYTAYIYPTLEPGDYDWDAIEESGSYIDIDAIVRKMYEMARENAKFLKEEDGEED